MDALIHSRIYIRRIALYSLESYTSNISFSYENAINEMADERMLARRRRLNIVNMGAPYRADNIIAPMPWNQYENLQPNDANNNNNNNNNVRSIEWNPFDEPMAIIANNNNEQQIDWNPIDELSANIANERRANPNYIPG